MQTTKNNKQRNPNSKFLANAGWNLCKTLLWNYQEFNETEIEMAKELIEQYLINSLNTTNKFISFCERVELAYQFLQRNPTRFVPHPLKWLSPHFEYGFYGTKEWYQTLLQERACIPIHRFELRVMAEAYLQFIYEPTKDKYQIGKKAIAHYNKSDILQAFDNCILNFKYNN
jgi:hypothetical protein